jgi:hypothetical protein
MASMVNIMSNNKYRRVEIRDGNIHAKLTIINPPIDKDPFSKTFKVSVELYFTLNNNTVRVNVELPMTNMESITRRDILKLSYDLMAKEIAKTLFTEYANNASIELI